jgi:hypothetical protein
MQESMYKTAQSSMPPRLAQTTPHNYDQGIGAQPCVPAPPEIFTMVNTINERLDVLTSCIEKLAVKLGPVMRSPYPQEQCKDGVGSLPQTELGRILGEQLARLDLSIIIIRDLTERTML